MSTLNDIIRNGNSPSDENSPSNNNSNNNSSSNNNGNNSPLENSNNNNNSSDDGKPRASEATGASVAGVRHPFYVLPDQVKAILHAALGRFEPVNHLIKLINHDSKDAFFQDSSDLVDLLVTEMGRPTFIINNVTSSNPSYVRYPSQVFADLQKHLRKLVKSGGFFNFSAYQKMASFLKEYPKKPRGKGKKAVQDAYDKMVGEYDNCSIACFPKFNQLWDLFRVTEFHGIDLLMKTNRLVVPAEAFPVTSWLHIRSIHQSELTAPLGHDVVQELLEDKYAFPENIVSFLASNEFYRDGGLKHFAISAASLQELSSLPPSVMKNANNKVREHTCNDPFCSPHIQTGKIVVLACHIFAFHLKAVERAPAVPQPPPLQNYAARGAGDDVSTLPLDTLSISDDSWIN